MADGTPHHRVGRRASARGSKPQMSDDQIQRVQAWKTAKDVVGALLHMSLPAGFAT